MRALETELLELIQGVIAYKALSGGAAVDRPVVREHENAVLGELEVEFHYVSAHPDDGLDGRDGVLRIIPPVSPVGYYHYIVCFWVVNGFYYLLCMCLVRSDRSGCKSA